jgi:hypothetical protein
MTADPRVTAPAQVNRKTTRRAREKYGTPARYGVPAMDESLGASTPVRSARV